MPGVRLSNKSDVFSQMSLSLPAPDPGFLGRRHTPGARRPHQEIGTRWFRRRAFHPSTSCTYSRGLFTTTSTLPP
jgi:hypothetical protein